ncbi:hypothetical protein DM01DRAFT_1404747 [Hesseltinella vesiculosa]|uniref:Phytanoyl-CoA dioxygenase n=1 Tax=Hesseltinella vesiculosa TaxID=101127 RepID=A0A1X2GSM7_9FUNG|nr:hypothetical protein DM01DRAFT_1404747 [Hesseltinella vesiculosa]
MTSISEDDVQHYLEHGYCILEKALTADEVDMLHGEADELANYVTSEGFDLLHDFGGILEPLECGFLDAPTADERDYKTDLIAYIKRRDSLTPDVAQFMTSKLARWAGPLLYGSVEQNSPLYLLNEQYIIKPPKTKSLSTFQWHRDSDYYQDAKCRKEPTIACWIALDDVDEHNGTLYLGTMADKHSEAHGHHVVNIPAGSIVFMNCRLWHKSLGNESSLFRRAFMPQFCKRPVIDPDTNLPVAMAIPFE